MFNGCFKEKLKDFLEYKQINGFFKNDLSKFINFDKYTIKEKIESKYLTKEIVISFIDSHKGVKPGTKNVYASFMRQFGIYLNNIDNVSYILSHKYYPDENNFIPYIFTKEEEIKFFEAINKSHYKQNPKKLLQIKLIFTLLFSTGMRVGEVLNIERKNINYDNQTIYITSTKNDCDRIIAINEKLSNDLRQFDNDYNNDFIYFFERNRNVKYTRSDVYEIFRNILFKAKIQHTEKGPRVHDIRHTFVVNSFRQAINNNKDIKNFVSILQVYIGHKDIESTYKYLHLTSEFFPEIRSKIENIINLEREINYEEL